MTSIMSNEQENKAIAGGPARSRARQPRLRSSRVFTVKLAAALLLLVAGTAAARDVGQIPSHPDPKISNWFRMAKSPNGASCCDEADGYREGVPVKVGQGESTVIFRSWWAESDGYHLSLIDPVDLRPIHLIWDGPVVRGNPTNGAVVWLSRENGIVLVRCFSPGPQS
jgi:hypothetical protein